MILLMMKKRIMSNLSLTGIQLLKDLIRISRLLMSKRTMELQQMVKRKISITLKLPQN